MRPATYKEAVLTILPTLSIKCNQRHQIYVWFPAMSISWALRSFQLWICFRRLIQQHFKSVLKGTPWVSSCSLKVLYFSHLIQSSDRIWCDFDRASSLICGNKMPTRCNRGFYCRSYCLLNMFRASLCPSSGAQEYYIIWLCVRFAGCSILQTGRITLSSTPDQLLEKPQHKIPHAATTV